MHDSNLTTKKIYPHECRIRDLTYAADIKVDMEGIYKGKKLSYQNIRIGRMPIMLGSSNCHLRGKSNADLAKMYECPYDPRGYFIIKGTEKVVLMSEQMSKNRILIERDNKLDQIVANVTSSTLETKSKLGIFMKKNGKIYLKSNSFVEPIPIVIIFKAMGCEQDQEIFQLIGTEEYIRENLFLSFHDAIQFNIKTKEQALDFIGRRIRNPIKDIRYSKKKPIDDARDT
jgi:DNA-directed RNA polymerase III subunit RPC2